MNNPSHELVPGSSVQDENFLLNSTSSSADCGERYTADEIPDFSPRTPREPGDESEAHTIEPASWSSRYACPRSTVLEAYCQDGELWHAVQGRCKRWDCPGCGPIRTHSLCKQIEAAKPNRLVTLTAGRPAGRTPHQVWEDTRRMVPELIREMRKRHGDIEYCRVMEAHASGYPHYHLVVRGPWMDQRELSYLWCKLTDAFVVDVRKINPERRVAAYIAKYLTKQTHLPFTSRRVTSSRGFFAAKPEYTTSHLNLSQCRREQSVLAVFLEREWKSKPHELVTPYHAVSLPIADRWDIADDEIGGGSW